MVEVSRLYFNRGLARAAHANPNDRSADNYRESTIRIQVPGDLAILPFARSTCEMQAIDAEGEENANDLRRRVNEMAQMPAVSGPYRTPPSP